ncbi:N-acetylglucosamine-6-sulfatase isoform X2 [Halyomorpha halys]|uniref:N-acetylglucosamine-6-sulfatase isoform X2 n=1 Tax=Halyomorpha halys TaxID=286706 RepID=UPI0006D4D15F|nr:N-acetylglucosamine-6-sulfatase-like [Halyomorpha halys]
MIYTLQILIVFLYPIGMYTEKLPNIVLFVTDDQDYVLNGMAPMTKTKKLIKNEGIDFTNAFATTPICCPSRSTLLSGLYQHNHNVFNNSIEGGCSAIKWQKYLEKETFAVRLKENGYNTFYAGKYLNQYGNKNAGGASHVPPGWDTWIGLIGNSKYFNYTLSVNGKKKYFSSNYLTRVIQSYARGFVKKQENSSYPFLMVIAPPAPHHPFTPEAKYAGFFEGVKVPRNIQFNFKNNNNKHWLLQMKPSPLPMHTIKLLDEMYARRWETLLSVDDLVESVVKQLDIIKELNNTYILYTSDNAFHLGQFSLTWDKRQLYEFDIRVPLLVRGPGLPKNLSVSDPVILPDIAPTLLHIGGIKDVNLDGKSFLPIRKKINRFFMIEYHGEGTLDRHSDCNIEDENVYGFEEIYNLKEDQFQIHNLRNKINRVCRKKMQLILKELQSCKMENCHEVQNYDFSGCF